ncbi:hypothetical protein [Leeia oryzae]|uniref:hypothetical protein n=1 Tax=Leeia oryzae TaxID=356662 RepID=UPI0012EAA6F9|nr:hypothetical protein [Leeia oryzae]
MQNLAQLAYNAAMQTHDPQPTLNWLDVAFGWLCLLAGGVLFWLVISFALDAKPEQITIKAILGCWLAVWTGSHALKVGKQLVSDSIVWIRWRRLHPPVPPVEPADTVSTVDAQA